MGKYIGIRLAHALVILAIVVVLVFIIARLIPGDAIMAAMAGSVDMHDPTVLVRVRAQYGLDQPLIVQFFSWIARFLRGDWGTSIGTGQKVLDMFMQRLPITLELFVGATLWSIGIGIPAGPGARHLAGDDARWCGPPAQRLVAQASRAPDEAG